VTLIVSGCITEVTLIVRLYYIGDLNCEWAGGVNKKRDVAVLCDRQL